MMDKTQNTDDIDLIDELNKHISFIKEVLKIETHPDFAGHVEMIIYEARDRIDIVEPLIDTIGLRFSSFAPFNLAKALDGKG